MKMNWSDILLTAGLTTVGCALVYVVFLRRLHKAVAERQEKLDQKVNDLATAIENLQRRLDASGDSESNSSAAANIATGTSLAQTAAPRPEAMQLETLAVITAAATTFLGKKARIRAAHALPAENGAGAWAQQGRVIVQTSHNPRPRA